MTQHFPDSHHAHFPVPVQANVTQPVQQYVPHPALPTPQLPYQPAPAATTASYPAPYAYPAPQHIYPTQNAYHTPTYAPPAYPYPVYPQMPYSQATYPPVVYSQVPYPQPVYPQFIYPRPQAPYPLVAVTPPERDNEINAHGYKESIEYPKEQAAKERLLARITFFTVIGLVIVFFFTPLTSLIFPDNISVFGAMLATFTFEIVLILGFFFVMQHAFPQGWKDALGLQKPRGINFLIGAGSGIGALGAAGMITAIFILFGADITGETLQEEYGNMPDWQFAIVALIFIPICAPLFEELLFRGILVGSAVRAFPGKVGFFVAVIATGLFFGSLHFPGTFDAMGALAVVQISCLGMFLAWFRLKTNSALITMTTHAVYNGSIVVLQLLVASDAIETIAFF